MKKLNIVILFFIILIIGLFLIYKISLIDNSSGDNIIIKKPKYGFEFSYPKNSDFRKNDEWDNGLSGGEDGGVYGYSASGPHMGPYTESFYIWVYNISLEESLATIFKTEIEKFGWQVEDVYKYGKHGKKISNSNIIENSEDYWGRYYCKLILEDKNLIYILNCNIPPEFNLKFYN